MILKEIYHKFKHFQHIVDLLELQSNISRKYLLNTTFCNDKVSLETILDNVEKAVYMLKNNADIVDNICSKISEIKNIEGTITNLLHGNVLTDVELFEVKFFCLLNEEIRLEYKKFDTDFINIQNLDDVIRILDPDNEKIRSFYIYDSYSKDLKDIRKRITRASNDNDIQLVEELRYLESKIEDDIRIVLSSKLSEFADTMLQSYESIAQLDIYIAKAKMSLQRNMTKPVIVDKDEDMEVSEMVNPYIEDFLKSKNRTFQPTDIVLHRSPCLITGANMSGKTVTLKTIALLQYMTQFGFFVPAGKLKIPLVDKVLTSINETESDDKGLSSFANEILKLNDIIRCIKDGYTALVLIDELARTTNPSEGRKIVGAALHFFDTYNVRSLISSHYDNIEYRTRRLRVKGLMHIPEGTSLNVDNINNYIDYSLVEVDDDVVPHDAIRIAELLGVDKEFITSCLNQ